MIPDSTPRQDRSRARRRAILDAALACYAEDGADSISMQAVRERAGASIGSIYHHFGGKDGLLGALYVEGLRDYHAALDGVLSGAHGGRDMVERAVMHHLDWAQAHPVWSAYLLDMRRAEAVAAVEDEIAALNRAAYRRIATHVGPYIAAGEIAAYPEHLYAPLILGPAQELVRYWARRPDRVDLTAARRHLARAAWAAMRPGS